MLEEARRPGHWLTFLLWMVIAWTSLAMEVRQCSVSWYPRHWLTGHHQAQARGAHAENWAENTDNWHRERGSEHVLSEGVIAVTPAFNGPIILFYISIIRSRDQFERFVTFWWSLSVESGVTAGPGCCWTKIPPTARTVRFCVFAFPN